MLDGPRVSLRTSNDALLTLSPTSNKLTHARATNQNTPPPRQSLLLVALVGSAAALTGFPNAALLPAVKWRGLPTSAALFSFCFSGHAVFPSLYASLRSKDKFPRVLAASFGLVCCVYAGMAVMG